MTNFLLVLFEIISDIIERFDMWINSAFDGKYLDEKDHPWDS